MNDTAQHIEERFLRMMLERPAEEKLRMAARMFSAAKKLARAGIQLRDRTLTSEQIKEELLLQFYGQDFTKDELRRILDSIFNSTRLAQQGAAVNTRPPNYLQKHGGQTPRSLVHLPASGQFFSDFE